MKDKDINAAIRLSTVWAITFSIGLVIADELNVAAGLTLSISATVVAVVIVYCDWRNEQTKNRLDNYIDDANERMKEVLTMAQEKTRPTYDGYLINFSSNTGYPTIFVNGKNVLLHRYVWEKERGTIPEGYEIHHNDKDILNYSINNLELIEIAEHHRKHAIESGLGHCNKGKPKRHISGACREVRAIVAIKHEQITFESISEASRKLNISTGDIWRVLNGKRKTAKGWQFKYLKEGD